MWDIKGHNKSWKNVNVRHFLLLSIWSLYESGSNEETWKSLEDLKQRDFNAVSNDGRNKRPNREQWDKSEVSEHGSKKPVLPLGLREKKCCYQYPRLKLPGGTWKLRWSNWQKQQKRCFRRPPHSNLPKQKERGESLLLPSYCQFLLLANPGRNCRHRSLGKNKAHKGQLLTTQRREGWGMDQKANRPRFSRTINFVQEHKWWWRRRLDCISTHPGIRARSWL